MTKIVYLCIFRLTLGKKTNVASEASRIFQNGKFSGKLKTLKFDTKIAFFGYFRAEI